MPDQPPNDRNQNPRSHSRHSPSRDLLRDDDFLAGLDSAEVGEDLIGRDYIALGLLGIVLPALLLVWGWF